MSSVSLSCCFLFFDGTAYTQFFTHPPTHSLPHPRPFATAVSGLRLGNSPGSGRGLTIRRRCPSCTRSASCVSIPRRFASHARLPTAASTRRRRRRYRDVPGQRTAPEIGRASCRERVCQYV